MDDWQSHQRTHPRAAPDFTADEGPPNTTEVAVAGGAVHAEADLYAPYDSIENGRHSTESVNDFLTRVPPVNCPLSATTRWLWVAYPHYRPKPAATSAVSLHNAADDQDQSWQVRCRAILDEYQSKADKITDEMAGKAKGSITRKLNPLRKDIPSRIQKIAKEAGKVCGKWMLFPTEDQVTDTWTSVCKGVLDGRLGHAAKIAAHPGGAKSTGRLVCVYTQDFSDVEDVRRVLFELVDMGLVPAEGYGIHYKCDAYTALGIESGNDYGIKASIYSSNQLLKAG